MAQLAIDFVNDTYLIGSNNYTSLATALASTNLVFSRASVGFYTDTSGVLSSVASGTLRRGNRGALIEPSRINGCYQASAQSNATWVKARAAVTADAATAPDGTTTADLFNEQTLTNSHVLNAGGLGYTNATTYAHSIYLKAGTNPYVNVILPSARYGATAWVTVDLSTGAILPATGSTLISATVESLSGGWYRVILIATSTSLGTAEPIQIVSSNSANPGSAFISYLGTSKNFYMWNAQFEVGAYASSPIDTTTTSVTRAADLLQIVLPAGSYTLQYTFDDASTQTISGITGGTTYSVPTTLNRRYITRIDDVTIGSGTAGQHLSIGQTATVRSLGKGQTADHLGISQTATGTVPAAAGPVTGDKLAVDFVQDLYSINGSAFTAAADAITAGKMTIVRASANNSYKDSAGNLSYFAANTLRRGDRGALVEASRTNVVWQSEAMEGVQWSPARLNVVADQTTGPDGNTTADMLNDGVASQGHIVANRNANLQAYTLDQTYTESVFFKVASPGNNYVQLAFPSARFGANPWVTLDMSAGTVVVGGAGILAASVTPYVNGWMRLIMTAVCTSTGNGPGVQIGLSDSAVPSAFIPGYAGANRTYYAFGAQLEVGTDASSYIQVTGTGPITRNADALSFALPTGTYVLRFVFDDLSVQNVAATSVGNLYTVPTNLNRRYIRSISDVSSSQTQHLGISQTVTTGGTKARGSAANSLGLSQVAKAKASLFADPTGRAVALKGSMFNLALPKTMAVFERHQDISIPAGDSLKLVVTVQNTTDVNLFAAGAQYSMARHYGGARRISKSEQNGIIIDPPSDPDEDGNTTTKVTIGIRPVDTADLRPGEYIHELQLHARDDTITTVMRGKVTIAPTIAAVSPLGDLPLPRAVFGDASQHLDFRQTASGLLVVPQADTSAALWIANLGSDPGDAAKTIYDQGVKYLKGIGSPSGLNVWDDIVLLHLYAAHTATAAMVNAKDPTGLKGLPVTNPAFHLRRGVELDGVGAKINTQYNPATIGDPKFSQDNAGMTGRNDAVGTNANPLLSTNGTTGSLSTLVPGSSGTSVGRINATANLAATTVAPFNGTWSINRTSSTLTTLTQNGVDVGTSNAASSPVQSLPIHVGGATSYFNGLIPYVVLHSGLSPAKRAALVYAMDYMVAGMLAL